MNEAGAELVVETRGLTKRYGDRVAVDGLDLEIRRGEIFGMLGPNGAGKTTTILMLLGLTEVTEGTARVVGLDPTRDALAVKHRVGFLPDDVGFYDNLTARANLAYAASLNRVKQDRVDDWIDELLGAVGLAADGDRPVGGYSRGMRQRLGIAEALVKVPDVLILDEPTVNIDPEGVREILGLVRGLCDAQGITVILASHLLHQVQQICDRIGIFVGGRMVGCGTVAELARSAQARPPLMIEVVDPEGRAARVVAAVPGVERVVPAGAALEVHSATDVRREVAAALVEAGVGLVRLDQPGADLDAVYHTYFVERADAELVDG